MIKTVLLGVLLLDLFSFPNLIPNDPPAIKINLDGLDQHHREAVVFGLLTWEFRLSNFRWRLSRDKDAVVFKQWSPNTKTVQINGGTAGMNSYWQAATWLDDGLVEFNRWPDRSLGLTCTHEIGHLILGRWHNPDTHSVMYPDKSWMKEKPHILDSDLGQLPGGYSVRRQESFVMAWSPYDGEPFKILDRKPR